MARNKYLPRGARVQEISDNGHITYVLKRRVGDKVALVTETITPKGRLVSHSVEIRERGFYDL